LEDSAGKIIVDQRLQVQLEENEGERKTARWIGVVFDLCSSGSDKA